jgi:hypothetical protein
VNNVESFDRGDLNANKDGLTVNRPKVDRMFEKAQRNGGLGDVQDNRIADAWNRDAVVKS